MSLSEHFHQISKIVLPERCLRCQTLGSLMCDACVAELHFVTGPQCLCCGVPFGEHGGHHRCSRCENDPPFFDEHRALFAFNQASKDLIHTLKYQNGFQVRRFFSKIIKNHPLGHFDVDFVMAVPLHRKRLAQRGYNQSELLAKAWADFMKKPVKSGFIRVKQTRSQTGLNRKQRFRNLQNAFAVSSCTPLQGKRILLVDDVLTTGATLNMAAKALKNAGAKAVLATSLAMVV